MAEQPNRNNKKPNKPLKNNPMERSKVMIIWAIIIAAMVGLVYFNEAPTTNVQELNIHQVVEASQEDRIAQAVIRPDPSNGSGFVEIRGELGSGEGVEGTGQPFRAIGRLTDENLQVLQQNENVSEQPANTFLSTLLLNILPFVLIILLLYFLFVRQLKSAGRGAMSFGKSKAKMLTRDREKVLFKDVAGCDEAKEEVAEIVDFLKDPKKFTAIGGRVPKGVLLVGPPGTGKTLIAKAIAGEADVPFFSISGSDFVEMFVGVGAARVRDMFEQGRKNAPCLIFIDEIDAVGRQRGAGLGGGNDEREQTLNSLLVEMDGFETHEGVIIIAATNRPDVLDNALLRPGRFDRQILIDLPDVQGRKEILDVHAKKIKLAEEVDLSVIARNTSGFSGADLANLLNEGALIATRHGKKKIDLHDLDEARDKIAYGRERRRLMDDEDKRITAYHEAGHAIVQAVIDEGRLPIHKVTIIPRGQSLGSTMFIPSKDFLHQSKRFLLNQICCAMGGRVAEELTLGDVCSGAAGDIKQATKIARHMVCDWGMSSLGMIAFGENKDHVFLGKEIERQQNYSEQTARQVDSEIRRIIDEQYERCRRILNEHRSALQLLADALLEHETLEGKHVHEILEHGKLTSAVTKALPKKSPKEEEVEKEPESATTKKKAEGDELGPNAAPAPA